MYCIKRVGLVIWMVTLSIILPSGVMADDFELTPSLTVSEEYNDNIFFSYSGTEDDYITTISVGLQLTERTEQLDMNLSGSVSPYYYSEHSEWNDIDQDYFGGINYLVSPLFSVNADARYDVSNRRDRDVYTTGIVLSTNRRKRQVYGIGFDYTPTESDAMDISFDYSLDKWDDTNITNQKSTDYRTTVNYSRSLDQWWNNTTGRLNIGFDKYEYETSDTYNYTTTIGVQHLLSQTFDLTIDVGVTYTDANFLSPQLVFVPPSSTQVNIVETNNKTYSGTGRATLAIQGELTTGSVSINHGITPASGSMTTVQRTSAELILERQLTERSAVTIATGFFHNRADRDEFSFFEIDEDSFNFRPSIQWEFIKNFIIGVGYRFVYIDDHKASTDRKQNVVYLQASYGIPLFE